jgi:fumarate reductase subunit C
MNDTSPYTEFHPRWHRTRMSTWWWLGRWSFVAFILREISSVFIAWFVIFLLLLVHAVSAGKDQYEWFLDTFARHPLVLVLNAVSLVLIVFHAVTWFNLAPQAMVVRMRGQRVPGLWITAGNYALWAVVSLLSILLLLLLGRG